MNFIRPAEPSDWKSIKKVAIGLGYEAVSDSEARQWLDTVLASEEQRVWVGEAESKSSVGCTH